MDSTFLDRRVPPLARLLRIEYPGALYHVTSRGNEKKDIFRSIKDSYTTYSRSGVKGRGTFSRAGDLREGLKRLAENPK
jgi:hypothetical protein